MNSTMGTVQRIRSGGQTGVDRAALDWAIANSIEYCGWCPAGRRSDDGQIPARYKLVETPSAGYKERTLLNIRDSDATLIINIGELSGGTKLTHASALKMNKPVFVFGSEAITDVSAAAADSLLQWLFTHNVQTLNVAGPRERKTPGIYNFTLGLLSATQQQHEECRDVASHTQRPKYTF